MQIKIAFYLRNIILYFLDIQLPFRKMSKCPGALFQNELP